MHMHFASPLAALALAGLVIGCGPTLGDRSAQHGCPSGETCFTACPSGATCSRAVDGLSFEGTSRTADGARVGIVAVHGEERVTLRAAGAPYTDPVRLETDPPGVLRATLVAPSLVVLQAEAAGTSMLRVLEPTTGQLLDRVEVRTIDGHPNVRVRSLDEHTFGHELGAAFAVRAGARVPLEVRLASLFFSFDEVVDTTLEVRDAGGALLLSGLDGAPYALTITAPASTFALSVRGAGATERVEIPVVDHLDDLLVVAVVGGVAGTTTEARLCVVPLTAGVPVYTDEAPRFEVPDWRVAPSTIDPGCVEVSRDGAHDAIDVTSSLDGLTVTRAVRIGTP